MNLGKLVWRNLLRRRGRFIFTLAGVSVGMAAFVALMTIGQGLTGEIRKQAQGLGANLVVTPKGWCAYEQISVLTGDGIDGVLQLIEARARVALDGGEAPIISRERHRILLRDAATALAAFTTAGDHEIELGAEDLRRAAYALGRLTGRVDVEDVLGEIFGRFCIGK